MGWLDDQAQAAFLDNDPLRTTLFNFYTNLVRASQPAVGFRRDTMLKTLQALNTVYQALVPAVQQALKFTRSDAREETQQALEGLTSGAANSAVGILLTWNRVITGGTSTYVVAPSFTADIITLAKRLEHAHMVVLLINYDVPAWYRTTYTTIENAVRAASNFASSVWDNFTDTVGLVYLALKLLAAGAVGYVAYTLATNVATQGFIDGTDTTFTTLRGHVPRRQLASGNSDEGSEDE